MTDRTILSLTGSDRVSFLQGLVSNDVSKLNGGIAYAALLTPQGKYLADFFVVDRGDDLLIDVAASLAPMLFQRLSMYKLRSDVAIVETDLRVKRGVGPAPDGAYTDPRHAGLGWRLYGDEQGDGADFDALRVEHIVPETGIELTPDAFILEQGFERLNGVDFRKGCYVGQEVTARMKHKTELRKGIARVRIEGTAQTGDTILSGEKEVGTLQTVSGDRAIAYLRFDRVSDEMTAGQARVWLDHRPE